MELWPLHHLSEQSKLANNVQALGRLYGIDGLQVQIEPGAGWSCAKTEQGLVITADPEQSKEGNSQAHTDSNEDEPLSPELTSLFITAHELGHAADMLDRHQPVASPETKSDHFFRCLVDDTVIDKRSRRIPLFNAHADDVYARQMPTDLTTLPKHVQLMYGLRIGTVSNQPLPPMDKKVAEIVSSIRNFIKNGESIDIMAALADPRTSLRDRRQIAQRYIRPQFDALLEEDKEERDQQSGDSSDDQGDFDEAYEDYEQAAHGHRSQEQGDNPDVSDQNQESSSEDLAEQIADSIKQSQEEQKASKQQAASKEDDTNGADEEKTQMSDLAGSIAAELELCPADAMAYAQALKKYKSIIQQVAEVMMQLSAPTEAIMSPRYRLQSRTEGHRLHPRTMARVALQLASDQEQAIWQPVERRAQQQEIDFGGLDIHFLADVSGSMLEDDKAACAANTEMCLVEGVQLARFQVSRRAGQYHQPDVRTQIIAFGSSNEVLSPLQYEPTGPQKGKAYSNLLRPSSNSTMVSGALLDVTKAVLTAPNRDHIIAIISDGVFEDSTRAADIVAQLPKNTHVVQLIIGGAQSYISPNHENLSKPEELPKKLYSVLTARILGARK